MQEMKIITKYDLTIDFLRIRNLMKEMLKIRWSIFKRDKKLWIISIVTMLLAFATLFKTFIPKKDDHH